ncbi:MAG: hypothetical protein WDN29_09010 [Methylovirgula sp.]
MVLDIKIAMSDRYYILFRLFPYERDYVQRQVHDNDKIMISLGRPAL